ncbi:MAG: sulfotransferase [Actinomycetota bacterium]|nr:sulfotransferase [Actinomycetota bacterium]
MPKQDKPVAICLIGGSGRSGTTILRTILARHPDVASFPTETRFLIDPDGLIDFYDSVLAGWSPYVYDAKVRRLKKLLGDVGSREVAFGLGRPKNDPRPTRDGVARAGTRVDRAVSLVRESLKTSRLLPRYFNVNLSKSCPEWAQHVDRLVDELVEFSFPARWTGTPRWEESRQVVGPRHDVSIEDALGGFFRSVMACVAHRQGASHVVEDSPYNHLSFDRTLALVPEARLVHIYRDPRDVVASMTKMNWGPSDPIDGAKLYAEIFNAWTTVKEHLPAGSYIEISLEELVVETRNVLGRVCDFFDLPWDDVLLDVDLGASNQGRWQVDIPDAALGQVERLLADPLQQGNYA